MPKFEHKHNPPAPEFTTYKVAQDTSLATARTVLMMREAYDDERVAIAKRRAERLDARFWATRLEPHPVKVRGGYPKRRERDEDMPSKRKVPFSHFTRRFRTVGKKIEILHATRGWKAYA